MASTKSMAYSLIQETQGSCIFAATGTNLKMTSSKLPTFEVKSGRCELRKVDAVSYIWTLYDVTARRRKKSLKFKVDEAFTFTLDDQGRQFTIDIKYCSRETIQLIGELDEASDYLLLRTAFNGLKSSSECKGSEKLTSYRTMFLGNLDKIYNNIGDHFPDATLKCVQDGRCLQCHRVILSSSSDYFKNIFTWNSAGVVEVHNGITGETLNILLRYIYSGEISVSEDNATDVLLAANYFLLTDVVDICVEYILKNLSIHNSIHLLRITWQLDLTTMRSGVQMFVAENFSYILEDSSLKELLLTLPTNYIVELLKSNDLIFRYKESGLLTHPLDREKCILEFILTYTGKFRWSTNVMKSLLACVRWPILKLFNGEEFLFEDFIPRLGIDATKTQLEILNIPHFTWFWDIKCPFTEEGKSTYTMRAFTCSELIQLPPMGGSKTIYYSSPIIAKEDEHLVKLDIVTSIVDIIAGIGLYFASKGKIVHKYLGAHKEGGTNINTIMLEKNEHIISVYGNAGNFINSLTFETSKGKIYGPYGGDWGTKCNYMDTIMKFREESGYSKSNSNRLHLCLVPAPRKRVALDSILVGISGRIHDELALTSLKFVFREMLPSSRFLIDRNITHDNMFDSDDTSNSVRSYSYSVEYGCFETDEEEDLNDIMIGQYYDYYCNLCDEDDPPDDYFYDHFDP